MTTGTPVTDRAADLQPVGLADDAVGGRAHLGAGEVEQGLLARDPRGLERRLVGRAAAAQRRLGGGGVGAGIGEPLARLLRRRAAPRRSGRGW